MQQRKQSGIVVTLLAVCLAVLSLSLALYFGNQGRVYVTDESGAPVESAVIWVTYVSSTKAYEFRTDARGQASLELPDYRGIHGISISKGSRSSIILENITWPLRVVIREKK
jgi:hypothetical protein